MYHSLQPRFTIQEIESPKQLYEAYSRPDFQNMKPVIVLRFQYPSSDHKYVTDFE
ncbi:hypothetical protein JCM19055_4868 [Geomicrobium sp. JCM 19055]|nr:hypothetical protein JCM19055_4868 [Geomicrobium sp. JCM 19055]